MSWVIAKHINDCLHFWTGEVTDFGEFPKRTLKLENARKFPTAQKANDIAGQHERLGDWKAVRA